MKIKPTNAYKHLECFDVVVGFIFIANHLNAQPWIIYKMIGRHGLDYGTLGHNYK